ncbi:hypothetical protein FDB15_14560 [Clostridium botulinum]|uniref:hypothetical protein n=1 Tax=unclassified Clostridium TaxID=2614128 RepID=UPI000540F2EE|nr:MULTISPECIES: hypothetical protein [unclassified Clostridium]AIY80171.1 putative membrane protein [Clostridium botulinum 202F]KAI3344975.1 hypothetical protein CIT17_15280 [Clostridium botulinum]KON14023.1 hypothetical protein ACP50_08220 [Clostridium botulinum]MBY6987603.1 hypothetical protein [Clostridium botulinum]MBY7008259.1 hypothetical protein [Clostridium botulinum]
MDIFGIVLGFIGFIGIIITSGLCFYSRYSTKCKYKPKQILMFFIVFSMALVVSSQILWTDSNKENEINKSSIEESNKIIK